MTVSGILSGLLNPLGNGHVLARAAARVEPSRPSDPIRSRPAEQRRAAELGADYVSDAGTFDTHDVVDLSPAARRAASAAERSALEPAANAEPGQPAEPGNRELTEQEQAQVADLKRRDEEVHQHEQAHLATAGSYARGGAQFEYETGPDGKRYAIGGEVTIDTTPVRGDPPATIRKMETVRAAALAPVEPSAQDRAVAARAAAILRQAEAELARKKPSEGGRPGSERASALSRAASPAQLVDTYA